METHLSDIFWNSQKNAMVAVSDSSDRSKEKAGDQKVMGWLIFLLISKNCGLNFPFSDTS